MGSVLLLFVCLQFSGQQALSAPLLYPDATFKSQAGILVLDFIFITQHKQVAISIDSSHSWVGGKSTDT